MPSLTVDDNQTSFSYRDSGKPPQEIYTTLVILHGTAFHSHSYQRLFPLASSKGLRLICIDRRDYGETTLYNPSELKVLADGNVEELGAFMEARGTEIAAFLFRIIDELSLPPPTADGKDGGLGLMGWSVGNATAMAAIACADRIPAEMQRRLHTYLRKFVLQAPPSLVMGFDDPPEEYSPFSDETIPPEGRGPAFLEWVSSYFQHGDLSTQDSSKLNTRNPDKEKKSTFSSLSPEVFQSLTDVGPLHRSETFVHPINPSSKEVLRKQANKALFDSAMRVNFLPNLSVWLLVGGMDIWNVPYGSWEASKRAKASGTDLTVYTIPGANHFVLWDEPEKTIEAYAHCLFN